MERLSVDVSTIETLRAQHYATVRAFIAAEDRAGLEQWLAENGMALWLVTDCAQNDTSVLVSRACTAINDWCEVQLGRASLLEKPDLSARRSQERRRAQMVFG